MSEGKHTKLPWERSKYGGIYPVKTGAIDGGYLILKARTSSRAKGNEELAVKACNSYDQDQETIKALVKALEDMIVQFAEYTPQLNQEVCWEIIQSKAALALAKKKGG